MLAKKYKSVIKSITHPIEGIYTLEFAPLGRSYKYLPGQFLHLAIDNEYDGIGQWPDSRCFSMQSNPDEETIKISYSIKGEFTKQMEQLLKVGSEVWLKLPYGDLFQQAHSKEKTVFIAGGTGLTPFLSLFTHESFNEYIQPKIYLGFRSKSQDVYEDELKRIKNNSIVIHKYIEDINGIIDIQAILNENGIDASYFISGPPAMIKSFKSFLIDRNVAESNVLTDDWE
jgi:NAD(P)H-flavin reductase